MRVRGGCSQKNRCSLSSVSAPCPAYSIGKALPQGPSRDFHPAGHSELRVSRGAAACESEILGFMFILKERKRSGIAWLHCHMLRGRSLQQHVQSNSFSTKESCPLAQFTTLNHDNNQSQEIHGNSTSDTQLAAGGSLFMRRN